MKTFIRIFLIAVLAGLASLSRADSVPEFLHYKFSGTGTSVPNLASNPPAGTATATIMGGLTQTGADLNTAGGGHSLVGSGVASSTDYLNTGWVTSLTGTSWTISFVTSNIGPSATLYYIFGDATAGSFRCFTNGVAGASNWILRGPGITDVYVNGGATVATHRTTFVYDNTSNTIYGYLDGVLVSTVAQSGPISISGSGPFKVVGYGSNVGAPAGGLLDDFRVYSRALSAVEVANIDTGPTPVSSAPAGSPAASATGISFSVAFSEAVSGVTADDFTLTRTGSAVGSIGTPTTADGITWTVPISGIAGTGTIRLDVNSSGTGIVATATGNTPLFNGFTGGTVHNVAVPTAPAVVSSAPAGSPAASATGMSFSVAFSEAVSGVTADDFTLTRTGSAVGSIGTPTTADGITWTVPISGIAGTGTIRLDLNSSGTGIVATAAGNTPIAGGFNGGTVHNVVVPAAPTVPAVVSSAPAGSPAASVISMSFSVAFSEAVSGVTADDFTLTRTGNAVGSIGTPTTANGITWTVPISGIAGTGTIRLDLNSSGTGIVATAAGNTPIAAGFTGGTVHNVAVPAAAPVIAVPSLSEGGLVMLASLMALFGLGRTRRTRM